MYKILSAALCVAMLLSFCGCAASYEGAPAPATDSDLIEVPDIVNTSEEVAKGVVSSMGLIPVVEYEYSDHVEKGNVLGIEPKVGSTVKKGTRLQIVVSKGPKRIESKDSVINWWHVGEERDDWNFYAPYILDGYLYIAIHATFAADFKLEDFGTATLNDRFDKRLPVKLLFSNDQDVLTVSKGQEAEFTIKISVQDLEIEKSTSLDLELVYYFTDPKDQEHMKLKFTISW